MSINAFIVGDIARISTALSNPSSSAAVDPGALVLKIRKPDETLVTLTYGIDMALNKDSVGNYHADIALDQAGVWRWRWEATGANAGVAEGMLTAKASQVL